MEKNKINNDTRSPNLNNAKNNKCNLCEKGQNCSLNSFNKAFNKYSDLNTSIKIHDPIFFFNKRIIENMLNLNSLNGNELISPCSCEKKFHKNCILLSVFHSNNIFCESCLEIYNIKSTEKLGFWRLVFSKRNYHSFIPHALFILLLTVAIYFIGDLKLENSELYFGMKVFFVVSFILIDLISIIIFVVNCFKLMKNTPPVNICIETKEKMQQQSEIEMRNNSNLVSQNQNSNQNFIISNAKNLSTLYKLNKISESSNNNQQIKSKAKNTNQNLNENKRPSILPNSNFNSAKNFVDYNEFFFNVFRIEIFESKLNSINRNKIIESKLTEHSKTVTELNDDEFQQNILIKYMDFNSSAESFEDCENNERKRFANKIGFNNNNYNNSNKFGKRLTNSNLKIVKSKIKASLGTPISQQDFGNDSDNEAYYKKLSGMFPDSPLNFNASNNIKLKKILTGERENSENFNTYLNSVSVEKFKCSHKDLTGLNISNINHENRENISSNNINNNNNNEEKLILKENLFGKCNNNLRNPSNSNLIKIQNDSFKIRSKASFKDLSNDSMGSQNKFSIADNNQGINYRDFIVTDEKDFTNNGNFKFTNPRNMLSSEKVGQIRRKDSKIPSAVFGELRSFRARNSVTISENILNNNQNDLSDKLNLNSNLNIFSNNNNNNNNNNNQSSAKVPNIAKVIRRYSSFSPLLTKMMNMTSGSSLGSENKKAQLVSKNKGEFGMNIFSNNAVKNSSFDKSIVKKGTLNNLNMNKNMSVSMNENYVHAQNQGASAVAPKKNSLNNNDSAFNKNWRKSNNRNENKTVLINNSANSKFNLINEEFGGSRKKSSDFNIFNNLNSCKTKESNSYFKQKLLTISPNKNRKFSSKDFGGLSINASCLRQSFNFNLDDNENGYMIKKLEKLRSSIISQSVIGLNRNLTNKLSQENIIKTDSNISEEIRNLTSSNSESQIAKINSNTSFINNNTNPSNSNYNGNNANNNNICVSSKIKEDKNFLMKTSFMKESDLKTINEECEIATNLNKNTKTVTSKILTGYESEFLEENREKYEKNKSIVSSELNKFVDYPKEKQNTISNARDSQTNSINKTNHNSNNNKEQLTNHYEHFNTVKNIKNHLMDNKDDIIAEDSSDTFSASCDSSSDDETISSRSCNNDSKNSNSLNDTLNKKKVNNDFRTELLQSDLLKAQSNPNVKTENFNCNGNETNKINFAFSDKNLKKRFSLEVFDEKVNEASKFKNEINNINNKADDNEKEKELKVIDISEIENSNNYEDARAEKNQNIIKDSISIPMNNFTPGKIGSLLNIDASGIDFNNNEQSFIRTDSYNFNALKSKPNENKNSKFDEFKAKDRKSKEKLNDDYDYDRDELNLENLILVNSSEDESED